MLFQKHGVASSFHPSVWPTPFISSDLSCSFIMLPGTVHRWSKCKVVFHPRRPTDELFRQQLISTELTRLLEYEKIITYSNRSRKSTGWGRWSQLGEPDTNQLLRLIIILIIHLLRVFFNWTNRTIYWIVKRNKSRNLHCDLIWGKSVIFLIFSPGNKIWKAPCTWIGFHKEIIGGCLESLSKWWNIYWS